MAADSGYVTTHINENRKATMSVNHEGLVLEDISNLLENESYNDVTIELENGNVEANKVIICARSEYFAEVFKCLNSCEAQGKGRARGRPRKVTQRSFIDGGWWMVDILSLELTLKLVATHPPTTTTTTRKSQ